MQPLKKYKSLFLIIIFFLVIALLRFYNYENRWGLAQDQAAFAITARYAMETKQLPLLGPFSSAGPFQTGGEWYWIVMLGTFIYPFSVLTPWVMLGLLSIIFVFLMIFVGKEIINKFFGIILGILSAVSTAQIAQSTNLSNQTPVALFSLLAIFFMVKYVKTKKKRYLFFLGLAIGAASSIHLQGIALFPLAMATLIIPNFPKISLKEILLILSGIVMPWLPVFYADYQNNFYNINNMLNYLFQQNKVSFEVLGRRWLTFLSIFIPNAWAHIIGGFTYISYVIILLLVAFTTQSFLKKLIPKTLFILIVSAISMLVILRYTRTPLFDSFIVFIHPFVIILTGWVIYKVFQKHRLVGLALLCIIVFSSLYKDIYLIKNSSNFTAKQAYLSKERLTKVYPSDSFAIYDYQFKNTNNSLPLVLFLQAEGKISDHGRRIGVVTATPSSSLWRDSHLVFEGDGYQLFDLNASTGAQLGSASWALMNPSEIYTSTQKWYFKKL